MEPQKGSLGYVYMEERVQGHCCGGLSWNGERNSVYGLRIWLRIPLPAAGHPKSRVMAAGHICKL